MPRTRSHALRSGSQIGLLKLISGLPNRLFIILIRAYQLLISPILPPTCRFQPSCSAYSLAAFRKYSLPKALWLSTTRILRCNPFCKGGYDPLP
ncbi:MAG TPA: membrane protein insertion efficiency factor YidD [Candidatus Cloacimonadota bacterium]|nr:membrane protein insertion efficiency factor YidD [Candidatus Cloacimonadota bacterium]HPS38481.1 membrane protein insertion efficiency factor YidD [Candidatus Cloacimonadota bacterium]